MKFVAGQGGGGGEAYSLISLVAATLRLQFTLRPVTLRYTLPMIRSFKHKGLEAFFKTGSKAGIRPSHARKLASLLLKLNSASTVEVMDLPGLRFHGLPGPLAQHYAVAVSGNWRLTFKFQNGDAYLVDHLDYH